MAKRKKRVPKSAYLKRRRSSYDPNSPYALKTRGQKTINISGLVRDPVTKLLYDAGTPTTVTYGKRGLTIARAVGPTAVAVHKYTEDVEYQHNKGVTKSTMIPRAAVIVRAAAIEAYSLDVRGRLKEWLHYNVIDVPNLYRLDMFFEGMSWVWVELDYIEKIERRSMTYHSKEIAEHRRSINRIRWVEQFPIPPPDPQSGSSSVPAPV